MTSPRRHTVRVTRSSSPRRSAARRWCFCAGLDFIATPAIQAPLWEAFRANSQPLEWHSFSDAHHGFRHPDNEGFQPHYADTAWPIVADFLERRV